MGETDPVHGEKGNQPKSAWGAGRVDQLRVTGQLVCMGNGIQAGVGWRCDGLAEKPGMVQRCRYHASGVRRPGALSYEGCACSGAWSQALVDRGRRKQLGHAGDVDMHGAEGWPDTSDRLIVWACLLHGEGE